MCRQYDLSKRKLVYEFNKLSLHVRMQISVRFIQYHHPSARRTTQKPSCLKPSLESTSSKCDFRVKTALPDMEIKLFVLPFPNDLRCLDLQARPSTLHDFLPDSIFWNVFVNLVAKVSIRKTSKQKFLNSGLGNRLLFRNKSLDLWHYCDRRERETNALPVFSAVITIKLNLTEYLTAKSTNKYGYRPPIKKSNFED